MHRRPETAPPIHTAAATATAEARVPVALAAQLGALGAAALAAAAVAFAASSAPAQDLSREVTGPSHIAVGAWGPGAIYGERLLSAGELLEADVQDRSGETVGEVEDAVIDGEGRIVALVVDIGGFLGLGETRLAVPWEGVGHADGRIVLPVDPEGLEDYAALGEDEAAAIARLEHTARTEGGLEELPEDMFRLTGLVGQHAILSAEGDAGLVEDAWFTPDGRLSAVAVDADSIWASGVYTSPSRGADYRWQAGDPRYHVGFGGEEPVSLDQIGEKGPGVILDD